MTRASEWSDALGRAWRDHLDGLEATLAPINTSISEALDLKGAMRIADIGCGGGGLTRHLANVASNGSHITGFDVSPDLVDAARVLSGSRPIDFVCANAQTHVLTAPHFDRLISRYGIMFFQDEHTAFENLASWLKPGGRFAFAVWADYADNPWHGVVRDVAGGFVNIPKAEPNQPGPVRYADTQRFTTVLARAGFSDVSVQDWSEPIKLGGGLPAPKAAEFGLSAFWGKDLPLSNPDYVRALERLIAILQDHETAGEVSMSARAHIVTGRI